MNIFCVGALVWSAVAMTISAWPAQPDGFQVIDGPSVGEDYDEWYSSWLQWKEQELKLAKYDANGTCTAYNIPQLEWTRTNLLQAQVMLHDRYLYDRSTGKYTVSRFLNDLKRRYGGLHSVLLWQSYPNSGIDQRNQWDFFRDLPGGLEGFRHLVQEFHSHNVKVILPYNPWDTATRDEEAYESQVRMYRADVSVLNDIMHHVNADGFNGDTLYGVPNDFFNCSDPKAVCPEGGLPTAYLSTNVMSWGYWWGYNNFPPVSRTKFLEPRHMVYVCARWSLNRIPDIQAAFFNGVGYETWENVWGIWIGISKRAAEAIRRVYTILQFFSFALNSATWRPYTPTEDRNNLFGSEFPFNDGSDSSLFTLINTAADSSYVDVPLISVNIQQRLEEYEFYDLYRGVRLRPIACRNDPNRKCVTLVSSIEKNGFSAVLKLNVGTTQLNGLHEFLSTMRAMTRTPLCHFDNVGRILTQKMSQHHNISVNPTKASIISPPPTTTKATTTTKTTSMVRIKGSKNWNFTVSGVQIEPVAEWTPNVHDYGIDVQFPWESRPWKNHSHVLEIADFFMDRTPVTNAQFSAFLKQSGFTPRDTKNFVRDWTQKTRQGREPGADILNKPVNWVSVEDARAFCAFYGKRLPHDWEWQYGAMGGHEYLLYPWGSSYDASKVPRVHRSKETINLPDVGSFAEGCTSSGLCDMVGLVWQMTDSFCDEHTCGLLLRGGSLYEPIPSTLFDPNWYFPQAKENNRHNKFIMLSESYDRSKMVGFRCVADVF